MTPELQRQIEAAFDYRGHVTLQLSAGDPIVGFLFNREFAPKHGDPFVELILEGSGDQVRYPIAQVSSIELTGQDHAAVE